MFKTALHFIFNHLTAGKREYQGFSFYFMLTGIILAVAVLTCSLILFSGYEKALRRTILGANSHLYIFRQGVEELTPADIHTVDSTLVDQPYFATWSPVVRAEVMAVAGQRVVSCQLRGIDWIKAELPTRYREYVTQGSWELTHPNEVVLGVKIARRLNVAVGDTIKLQNPMQLGWGLTGLHMAQSRCKVVGLYSSGMYEYDSSFIFCNYDTARHFSTTPDCFNIVEVKCHDKYVDKAEYLSFALSRSLGQHFQVRSWQYFNNSLFALLEMEKWVLFIILCFLVLIAAFNVVSTVSAFILEKRKEIGILKTIGAPNILIKLIYLLRFAMIGVVAVLAGEGLGALAAEVAVRTDIVQLKGEIYFVEQLYTSYDFSIFALVFAVAVLIILLAALIPLKNINKMQITDILRSGS